MAAKVDPIFLIIANSIMKQHGAAVLPHAIIHCRKTIRRYFAECLAHSATMVSFNADAGDVTRASFELIISPNGDDISDEVESVLEIVGVEIEDTPGSIVAMVKLNRFSGLDVNE